MSAETSVLRVIKAKRPRAKFTKYSHSSSFIDAAAQLGDGFHYVNLYDEQIDSNLIISNKNGLIMIHNTYLSSFAYNLFLCWIYGYEKTRGKDQTLDTLLAHNFKKFFAEQLYYAHNDIGSRALLLETLLYEQVCMVPVFSAKAQDATLSSRADIAADLMSAVVSFHELGHFFLGEFEDSWDNILENNPEIVGNLFDRVRRAYSIGFVEEFQCDAMAVVSGFQQYVERTSPEFILRVLVFAFAAFAVLFSLARSAKVTGEARQLESKERMDFRSLEKIHREHEIKLGIDRDFVERAKLVFELCQSIAAQNKVSLYGADGSFPLSKTILKDLLLYVDRVLECDDSNARAMSNLVAEALEGHDEGMEYLYLRSKTFTTNREESLQV
jgi:hypothetical protein